MSEIMSHYRSSYETQDYATTQEETSHNKKIKRYNNTSKNAHDSTYNNTYNSTYSNTQKYTNPKSPSPKVCAPCFVFKKSNNNDNKNKSKRKNNKEQQHSNKRTPPAVPEIRIDDKPLTNSDVSNNITQQHSNEVSAGFLFKLSPVRRKELKQQQQQQDSQQQQHEQQQHSLMRRSRLTLNNYYVRQTLNYPNIEYVNCSDQPYNDSNVTTATNNTGEIVCASTPRNERGPGPEAKTGRVVEKLWMQQAPPVIESRGFDPTAEAKLFEANEGIFIVDPDSGKKYRKGRFLGKGGFANCFEFTDTSTNAVYAGKIVCKSHFHKKNQRDKMLLEIKLHQQLCHENIVAFHDYFEDQDNLYMILELCSRKSLDELLKRRGILTEPEVRYYMRQVVEGCKYIHSKRIIHRDLKLGNLLLNGSMQIKIADFGLATQVSSQDMRKKSICGTPNYVAPEVIRRCFYSYEVDVWSIGCIMYTLLCGVTPFETNNLRATYDRISTATYSLPSYLSPPAREIIVRLLDLDPNNRLSLDQVLYEEFFTTGFAPAHLSPSTCVRRPSFPKSNFLSRAQSMHSTTKSRQHLAVKQDQMQPCEQAIRKVSTTHVITRSSPVALSSTPSGNEDEVSIHSKENTSIKSKKITTAIDLYKILGRCMGSIQKDTALALNLPDSSILYVTRWVDFSNKYGFAFQLSDDSTGVLFNDTTRMILREDSVTLKYVDWSNVTQTWRLPSDENMSEDCSSKLSVLLYVRFYMHKRLKPTRFESSTSTSATTTTTTPASPLSPCLNQLSSFSSGRAVTPSKNRVTIVSPEQSSISTESIERDSKGFASSEATSSASNSETIFTVGSSSSDRQATKSSSLLLSSSPEVTSAKKQTSKCGKENIAATSQPKPAKRSTSLRQQPKTTSTKQKRYKKRHATPDNDPPSSGSSTPPPTPAVGLLTPGSQLNSKTSSSTLANSSENVDDAVFVTKWFREDDGIIMQLSNGSYQVNFSDDHSKLILSLFNGEYVVTHFPIVNNNNNSSNNHKINNNGNKTKSSTKRLRNYTNDDDYNNQCSTTTTTTTTTTIAAPKHYLLFEICGKGCSPLLAEKLKVVRRKLYKLVNFEGQTV